MKERIKQLRKALGMTQQKFADAIGVKQNTVAQYEIGRNEPIESVINLICKEYNVNPEWLRTGSGEMFLPKSRKQDIAILTKLALSEEDDSFVNRLISVLAKLNSEEWQLLADISKKLEQKKE